MDDLAIVKVAQGLLLLEVSSAILTVIMETLVTALMKIVLMQIAPLVVLR